jgi:hypothetical protein
VAISYAGGLSVGRKIVDTIVNSTFDIDRSGFAAGLYFLKIKNLIGTQNSKVIKK